MNPKNLLSFSLLALLVGSSSTAFAQSGECTTDADCPTDYTCETESYDVCAPCEVGSTDCESTCGTETSSYCVPPPPKTCTSDASCDGDDVCVTYTFESCSGGPAPVEPCEEGANCARPEPMDEECTTESESYCVPPYAAPCSVDTDCGAGFTCEAQELCSCSGGGSTEPVPGDSTDPDGDASSSDPVEECVCEPSGDKYCQLIETVCTTDADCSGGLVCTDMGGGNGDVAVACVQEPCPEEEPVDPTKYCAPDDYYWGAYAGGGYDEAVADAAGQGDAELTGAERGSSATPDDGSGGNSSGGTKADPAACATGLGAEPAGSALLLFLGLALARIRRR